MPENLPSEWVTTTLSEVCLPVASIRPEDNPEDEFTYFDIGGIDNKRNIIAETKTFTGRSAPGRARQALRKGDILFSTVRTYLRKIARVDHDYPNPIGSTGFVVIRPAEGISSDFLFLQVLSEDFLQPLNKLQTGTSYPAVRERDVLSQPILLPPSPEQRRIAAKLNTTLSAIQRAETAAIRARDRLHRYRVAVLRAAVSGELTRDWREAQGKGGKANTETGDVVLHRSLVERRSRWEQAELERWRETGKLPVNDDWKSSYNEPAPPNTTDLIQIPETWAWASLEMISEIGSGISVSKNRRVINPVELPYLRVANVMRGYLDLSEIKTIRVEKDRAADYLLRVDDLLFTEGGDRDKLGRGWVPSEAEWEYSCRAGSATRYSCGDTIDSTRAVFGLPSGPFETGAHPANAFGIYDMHGNVREWTADLWHDSYDSTPQDGRPALDGHSAMRVVRGGGWRDNTAMLRSAARLRATPSIRSDVIGFRVVRSIG
jgi:type I restriction enzyme S subunit